MPWFKVDDTFSDHPKVDELSLAAVGLWTLSGSWSARNLTDGHVTPARIRKFGGTNTEVTELVTAGLWNEDGDGWSFRSWDEYQPTKESVEQERAAARKRMQDYRSKKRKPGTTSHDVTANSGERAENGQRINAVGSATPTHPDPTLITTEIAPLREDVEALCKRLADRIESNGVKRPTITKAWRDDGRKLIDIDGYATPDVERVIDWCQSDDFWKSNILSMNKLRKQFGALKIKADANRPAAPQFDPWSSEAYSA